MPLRRYSRNHPITAWGECRSALAWAADARCGVDYVTILQRIKRGFSPEDAIITPSRRRYELTAWGETKSIQDWAEDSRCVVSSELLKTRVITGWVPENAIITPIKLNSPRKRTLTVWGETKSVADWADDRRCTVMVETLRKRLRDGWEAERALSTPRRDARILTAWGESKTFTDWSLDPRARGGAKTLLWRWHQGWGPAEVVAGRSG